MNAASDLGSEALAAQAAGEAQAATPGQAGVRAAGEAHDRLSDVIRAEMGDCGTDGCQECTVRFSAILYSAEEYARAAVAAREPQPAPTNAEVAYEQWIEQRNPADVGSMAGFTAGWEAAVTAASGWPLCPNGCGCRLGTEDADSRDCACDGLCCYDEIEISALFAERDDLRRQLAAREPQPAPELADPRPASMLAPVDFNDEPELTEHVSIRFPADMIAAAKQLAAAEGMTVSTWIRREVEREAARREQPAPELAAAMAEARELRTVLDEATRYGRNLAMSTAAKRKFDAMRKLAGLPPVEGK